MPVPKIVDEVFYNGAQEKVARLGLSALVEEVRTIARGFTLLIQEKKDANGGAVVRRMLDERFKAAGGWSQMLTGGVDWTKCQVVNGTSVCIGVEVEVSSRSDLLAVDVNHLRDAILSGKIDVGAIIGPSDVLGNFLTDRGPKMADARRHVALARATDMPLILIAIEHDGAGDALPKQAKRSAGGIPPTSRD